MNENMQSIRETLAFQDLTEEEKNARGILGRLYGPCASIINATRNGRKYSDELWENVFNKNEIVNEMFANGGIPMEMDHPRDREETCSEKIAAMIPEKPKRDKDGHLICYVDLIDTPCGRIAYQLAKYGFKLGISSRGNGDLYTDANGDEAVDPDTYDFTTFDLVLLPAVKDARLTMCESYDFKNKKLSDAKKAINETMNTASDEDKRIMKDLLENLKLNEWDEASTEEVTLEEPDELIDNSEETYANGTPTDIALIPEIEDPIFEDMDTNELDTESDETDDVEEDSDIIEENVAEVIPEINEEVEKSAEDSGETTTLLNGLKEAIRQKDALKQENSDLKEKIAVGYTKVKQLEEELLKYKDSFVSLSRLAKKAKDTEKQNKDLNEQLTRKVEELTKLQNISKVNTALRENVSNSEKKLAALTESLTATKSKLSETEAALEEMTQKETKATKDIARYKAIATKYKTKFNEALSQYIISKANMLGVKPSEITNRLNEDFTMTDVDNICDELFTSNVNISKLPVSLTGTSKIKMTESVEPKKITSPDDGYEIDDDLLRLAGLLN